MHKTTLTAAFAVLLAASPMAYAAHTATDATTSGSGSAAVTSTQIEPGQILATDLKDGDVYNGQNQKIATIKDMILDHRGRVAAVVLTAGSRTVAVPMRALHVALDNNNKVKTITMDESRLKTARAFHLPRDDSAGGSTAGAASPLGAGGNANNNNANNK